MPFREHFDTGSSDPDAQQIMQELGYMDLTEGGELDESYEVVIGDMELVEPVPGVYFCRAYEGETHDQLLENLASLAAEAPGFEYLQEFMRLGEDPFNNVPDPLPHDMLLPVPVSPVERQVTDIDFVNEYARAAIEDMQKDPFYGPYVAELLSMPRMSEDNLLAMMVAVARSESGEHPIGRDFFHRFEPKYGVFSYSCFHVLMDENGVQARSRLNMSEGQTYHHYNACKLFLAYLVEKAIEKYEGNENARTQLEESEKKVLTTAPVDQVQQFHIGSGGIPGALSQAVDNGFLTSNAPYAAKLVAYVKSIGRTPTSLQPNDYVAVGQDSEGPFVYFYDSRGEGYSPKLRVDYYPADVMAHLESVLPNGGNWDYDKFVKFYRGGPSADYSARLQRHFGRVYQGLQSGEGDLYQQEIYPFNFTFTNEELFGYFGSNFTHPKKDSGSADTYRYTIGNVYAANRGEIPARLITEGAEKDFQDALRGYVTNTYSDWPILLRTDQVSLAEFGGQWRLVFCRDRHCDVVPMSRASLEPEPGPIGGGDPELNPEFGPEPPRQGSVAPESPEWSSLDESDRSAYLRSKYNLQKLRVVSSGDTLGQIIRSSSRFGIGFDELSAKEPYEEQIANFLGESGGGDKRLMLGDYIGYGHDEKGPYFVCCRRNGSCSEKLYGLN